MSVESFNRLVKLAARAFYDDAFSRGDNQQKTGKSDNRGIGVVILDALTRRQWVREEDLAKDLKLHTKQLRRALRFFEEEKLITRDHRKETAKGAKVHNFTVAATNGGGHYNGREDDKMKMHTHSYCCLDYAQIYDVIRYRLHRMKKKLKDELDDKDKVQEYICPTCQRRYTALDAGRLVSMEDFDFHCEACNGVLVPESEKIAVQDVGDADENARKRIRSLLQDRLSKMEVQLKPLNDQLIRVKDLAAPEFGTLQAWEARIIAERIANGELNGSDPSTLSQGLSFGGTPMPFIGETKVEVAFGNEEKGDIKSEIGSTPMKVLPPWMIKQGMNITEEQRGEVKPETKMMDGGYSKTADSFDDYKKSVAGKDIEMNRQDEYLKAYYAALFQRQQEREEAAKSEQDNLDPKSKGISTAMAEQRANTAAAKCARIRVHSGDSFAFDDEQDYHFLTLLPKEIQDDQVNLINEGLQLLQNERRVGEKSKRDDDGADAKWEEAPTGNIDLNVEAEGSDDEEEDDMWEEG